VRQVGHLPELYEDARSEKGDVSKGWIIWQDGLELKDAPFVSISELPQMNPQYRQEITHS